jgi:hypothetical protein
MHTPARFPTSYYERPQYKLQTLNLHTLSNTPSLFYLKKKAYSTIISTFNIPHNLGTNSKDLLKHVQIS